MKKIILTGPESTGKTILCKKLAKYFRAPYLHEYSREYINDLNRKYNKEDLLKIAKKQLTLEKKKTNLLFCDTDLITIKIWSKYKYDYCDSFIENHIQKQKTEPRIYLLCKPDIIWKEDPQREHPKNRYEIYHTYKTELSALKHKVLIIDGFGKKRFENALKLLQQFIL